APVPRPGCPRPHGRRARARRGPALRRAPAGTARVDLLGLSRARVAMASLLEPGSHRAPGLDDAALVRAMLRVEVAWMHALAGAGAATPAQVAAVADAADGVDSRLS